MYIAQPVHYVRETADGLAGDYRGCLAALVTVADLPREHEVCLVVFGADHSIWFRDNVPWDPQYGPPGDGSYRPLGGTWHQAEVCRHPKGRTEDPGYHSRPRSGEQETAHDS